MRGLLVLAAAAVAVAGCNQNTATGNDAQGRLDHAPTPAPTMGAEEALAGIANEAVKIETMSDRTWPPSAGPRTSASSG